MFPQGLSAEDPAHANAFRIVYYANPIQKDLYVLYLACGRRVLSERPCGDRKKPDLCDFM